MKPVITVSVTLFLATASIVHAADRRIEGTVKSVNADSSSITLSTKASGKEQDETLDVLKKAKVTVNGEAAALKEVRKGQKVRLTFNTELEVVTKIEAAGEGIVEPEVATLEELPPNGFHSAPWLSPDGLVLYFITYPPNEKQSWIWSARRKDKDSLFGEFQRLVPGSDPTVTGDGLEMILLDARVLHSATRKSADEPFSRPRKIPELDSRRLVAPSLSPDGLTLYVDRFPNETIDLKKDTIEPIQFTRKSLASKWEPPEVVKFTGLPAQGVGRMCYLSVTADGLHAFATLLAVEQKDHRVLVLSRKSKTAPFHADAMVSVGGDNQFAHFPRYVAATRELFCMRRNEADKVEIVVIRNFDPEAHVAAFDALGEKQ